MGVSRVSIYREVCDRDMCVPSRQAGGPCRSRGGAAVTGLRAVWGGAHARTGGRNCRTCGETNSPLPARKAERKDTSKMERYIVRNFLHFLQKHAILPASKERLRGGRRGGRGKSIPATAGREPAAGQTKQFIFPYVQHHLPIPRAGGGPKNRRPRTVFPFSICRAPGPGWPGANPRTGAHFRSERWRCL